MMTSKERMMRALHREKPDRLPVSVHQWQPYHLNQFMNGMDALAAFQATGMDAAIQYFEKMGQFWIPEAERQAARSSQWRDDILVVSDDPANKILHHIITTPEGSLTYKTGGNLMTTWITEYLVKKHEDIELIDKYRRILI